MTTRDRHRLPWRGGRVRREPDDELGRPAMPVRRIAEDRSLPVVEHGCRGPDRVRAAGRMLGRRQRCERSYPTGDLPHYGTDSPPARRSIIVGWDSAEVVDLHSVRADVEERQRLVAVVLEVADPAAQHVPGVRHGRGVSASARIPTTIRSPW